MFWKSVTKRYSMYFVLLFFSKIVIYVDVYIYIYFFSCNPKQNVIGRVRMIVELNLPIKKMLSVKYSAG